MRWARQARGRWVCENVIPQDPRDRAHYTPPSHYTINGEFEELEQEFPNTDLALLRERLVTVVPMYADPTHVGLLNQMKDTIWRPEE